MRRIKQFENQNLVVVGFMCLDFVYLVVRMHD